MTLATTHPRRLALPAAALAALLLAGCSTGHIGESWQCPLPEAGTCDSVAAADPAVPDANAAGDTVLGGPHWRVRGGDAGAVSPEVDTVCEAECGGFAPFAWLARLFDAETAAGGEKAAASGPVRLLPPEAPAPHPGGPAPADPASGPAGTAPFPAEPEARELRAGGETSRDDHAGFRTDEVVARIWIAPFVDAEGVYREASHVRVVLEPAGWRLAR